MNPETLVGERCALVGEQAHQVRRVLRMRPGDRLVLLDGRGKVCEAAVVASGESGVQLRIVHCWDEGPEPAVHVTLYQAVLKGDRFGWLLEKGTEAGVSRFVPMTCTRSVVGDRQVLEGKRGRWEHIIREAAEQSRRAWLPELAPVTSYEEAMGLIGVWDVPGSPPAIRLIPWEGVQEPRLRDVLTGCNLSGGARIEIFVGPEGGLTGEEISLARAGGIVPVSLGKRTLRSETAGVVATTAVLYEAGEI